MVSEFFEDVENELSDLVSKTRSFLNEVFSLTSYEFDRVINNITFDGVRVFKDKFGNSERVDSIGFGLSKGIEFAEVMDENGIYESNVKIVCNEIGEEVNVVVGGGFDSYGNLLGVSKLNEFCGEFIEIMSIMKELKLVYNIAVRIEDRDDEMIHRYIDANKKHKHNITSLLGGFCVRGGVPSVPSSRVIRDVTPNQLIRDKEGRGQTPCRAQGPSDMLSPRLLYQDNNSFFGVNFA